MVNALLRLPFVFTSKEDARRIGEGQVYMPDQGDFREAIIANGLMASMGNRVTEQLSTFSSWLIASYALVLGLLIANIKSVAMFLPAACIGSSAEFYLVALLFHVFQRYLAASLAAGAAVQKDTEELLAKKNDPNLPPLQPTVIFDLVARGLWWPVNKYTNWLIRKMLAGDLSLAGRAQMVMAQIHALLVFAQMMLIIWAAFVIARALG